MPLPWYVYHSDFPHLVRFLWSWQAKLKYKFIRLYLQWAQDHNFLFLEASLYTLKMI